MSQTRFERIRRRPGRGCNGTAPTCTGTMAGTQSVQAIFSMVFTDAVLTPAVAVTRAVDVLELRAAIGRLLAFCGLPPSAWTNTLTAGVSGFKPWTSRTSETLFSRSR